MHHAYLLVGAPEAAEHFLHEFLQESGFSLVGNPDYFEFRRETFGIDDARTLAEMSARKAFLEKKFFLILCERLTLEAQNALLKTFEEPPEGTHFFLVSREKELIIPTLLSRMLVLEVKKSGIVSDDPKDFIALTFKKRLEFAKDFADSGRSLPVFLDGLMLALKKKGQKESLERVFRARSLADQSRVPRLILEYLSLVV